MTSLISLHRKMRKMRKMRTYAHFEIEISKCMCFTATGVETRLRNSQFPHTYQNQISIKMSWRFSPCALTHCLQQWRFVASDQGEIPGTQGCSEGRNHGPLKQNGLGGLPQSAHRKTRCISAHDNFLQSHP